MVPNNLDDVSVRDVAIDTVLVEVVGETLGTCVKLIRRVPTSGAKL